MMQGHKLYSFLATSLYKNVIFSKQSVTRFYHHIDIITHRKITIPPVHRMRMHVCLCVSVSLSVCLFH